MSAPRLLFLDARRRRLAVLARALVLGVVFGLLLGAGAGLVLALAA